MRRVAVIALAAFATLGLKCTHAEQAVDGVAQAVRAGWGAVRVEPLSRVESAPSAGEAQAGWSGLLAVALTALGVEDGKLVTDAPGVEVDPASWAVEDAWSAAGDAPEDEPEPAALAEKVEGQDTEPGEADPASDVGEPGSGDERPLLVSTARETWIYAKPGWSGRRIGYLRAGSLVHREPEPVSHRKCAGGWYRVEPQGYACVGAAASIDDDHPVATLASRRPDMHDLPYLYVLSRFPPPPMYARLPSLDQQARAEPKRAYHLRKAERLSRKEAYVPPPPADPIPELLGQGGVLPGLGGKRRGAGSVVLGKARIRSGFGLLGSYDHEGRRFGLTTELALLPLDRTRVVSPSQFQGVRLSDEFSLPVAFVRSRQANRYRPHEQSGALQRQGDALGRRALVGLTGEVKHARGHSFRETLDGSWLRADQVVHVRPFKRAPRWAKQGRKWVDISILRQTLVAYEGLTPVYATLVSTGIDGLGDPEETHSTIRGTFLIHTKHVSVTMDGDEQGDQFDFRDVPFVQYFTKGYALHGAYWHDEFGIPRSHGCVNLAPRDAAWLFSWTTPEVPEGWHAALSLKKGTVVHIHP